MKINKNQYNIDKESKNALKSYKNNQININIKYHKIAIALSIFINLGLICFIFFYKTKIGLIKKLSNYYISDIDSQNSHLVTKRSSLSHKIVNIASLGSLYSIGILRFSFIFEKSEEFQNLKKIIYNHKKEIGEDINNVEERFTFFIYQGSTDSDEFSVFFKKIVWSMDLAIIIRTKNDKKFGIYHRSFIEPVDNEFNSNCTDVFLFTLDNDKIYKFIGEKHSIHFGKEKLISLGNDELVIYNDYFSNGGYINFPLQSFDFSTVNSNILTGENGKFDIENIEIYSFG